jgi:hypothetical protein
MQTAQIITERDLIYHHPKRIEDIHYSHIRAGRERKEMFVGPGVEYSDFVLLYFDGKTKMLKNRYGKDNVVMSVNEGFDYLALLIAKEL